MDGWEKGGELKPLDISKEVVTKIVLFSLLSLHLPKHKRSGPQLSP